MHQDSNNSPQEHRKHDDFEQYTDPDKIADLLEAERRHITDQIETEVVDPINLLLSQASAYEVALADNPMARLAVSVLASLGRQALQRTRDLQANLRPAVLEALGLEPALQSLVGQQMRVYGYQIALAMDRGRERLPFQVELALFRLVQDALHRAAHAGTSHCTVQLSRSTDGIVLNVSDNGKPSVALNMLELSCQRLEQLGAVVTIQENSSGRLEINVRLIAEIPLDLTGREVETLRLLAQGMSNKEIARVLNISARTVNFHLDNIYSKLGINSRSEAIIYAIRHGWMRGETSLFR